MTTTAIADTSFVVALTNARDNAHRACLEAHRKQEAILLPQSTLAEVAYMLGRERGNRLVAEFLLGLPSSKYRILALSEEDLFRTAGILEQYADSRVDFVDATIVAVAERLDIDRILTLDQRDFHMIRPRHRDFFELLPQP